MNTYAVKEIFHTLQGEGFHAGRAAVFVRFAGCNLWSGREADRGNGGSCSAWCDTNFVGTDGANGGRYAAAQLAAKAANLWVGERSRRFVVLTGGEPLLQVDNLLLDALKRFEFEIAVETNGTKSVPRGIDWVTLSPKAGTDLVIDRANELKLVFPQAGPGPDRFAAFHANHFYLQPMDVPGREVHVRLAAEYCMTHPQWKLSLQTHKIVGLP